MVNTGGMGSAKLFFYFLAYKIIIEIIYINSISPNYSYMGLSFDPNYLSLLISTFFLVIISVTFPKNYKNPSTFLFCLMQLFIVIPTLSYYWLNSVSAKYTLFLIISSTIISFMLIGRSLSINLEIRNSKNIINLLFLVYIFFTLYLFIIRGGIDARAFDFNNIYDLRDEYNLTGFTSYLFNWSAKAFFPFYSIYYLFKKKYIPFFITILLQILLFLSFGNKALLFSVGIVLMSVIITKGQSSIKKMILSMGILNLLSWILFVINFSDSLFRAIPYRLLFIPTQIQYIYYEYFNSREKLHLSDSLIGKIFSSHRNSNEQTSMTIGDIFYGNGTNANTGVFSDAYANGGLFAMLLTSFLLGLIFKFLDSTTRNIPPYAVVATFSYIMFVLNDVSLLTTLLTGGTVVLLLLLILLNSSLSKEKDIKQ